MTGRAKLSATPEAVERFRRDGFGMFIHWGIYAVLGRGEWVMHKERIPAADYEPLADRFLAERFNAREWVDLAAQAGQRYIVITSKHHDGFSMFDTALADYKVTRTPFARDPLDELADACRDAGIGLGFYHSLLDWHHPDYDADFDAYREFLAGQVRELCTRYGPVYSMWFDGHWTATEAQRARPWFRPTERWGFGRLYDMIHELQPACMIGNNHHDAPLPGEDFQLYEQELPDEGRTDFNPTTPGGLPLETCLTMNRSWGWKASDDDYKSVEELRSLRRRCRAIGSNLLLNVGPTPEGTIPAPASERLRAMGN